MSRLKNLVQCLKLHRIPEGGYGHPADTCVFGRALRQTGNPDLPEEMVYWVRLPSFDYGPHADYGNHYCWAQRVLFYFGHRGFRIHWRPL